MRFHHANVKCLARVGVSAPALLAALSVAHAEEEYHTTGRGVVEEVVVTAQRREQSLKDVPISVQAVTGDQLARRVITDTRSLASVTPTLNYQEGPSASASSFSLRGVTSVAQQGGIQPSTAMVIDGVPLLRQGEFVAELADIERIEVLNGPQGTLFGKNSTAGVVNITTKEPTDQFESWVEALTTTDEEYGGRAMFNAPLGERVRLRVNAFHRDQNPVLKNITAGGVAGIQSEGVAAKLAFELSEDWELLLSGSYSERNSTYGQFAVVGPGAFGQLQRNVIGVPVGRGETTINTNGEPWDTARARSFSATFNWRASNKLDVVSISNYTRFNEDGYSDVDGTPAGYVIGEGYAAVGRTYPFLSFYLGAPRIPDRYHYFSQELRANYVEGPINAVFGLFYQRMRNTYSSIVATEVDSLLLGQAPGTRFYNATDPDSLLKDRVMSAFADVTVDLTDQFSVFAGLRYTDEKLFVDYHRDQWRFVPLLDAFDPATGVVFGPPNVVLDVEQEKNVSNLSGRGGIQFQPTDNLNFYVSYARGYKAPAADLGSSLLPGVAPIIDEEIADAYELGAKMRLFDGSLALNTAVFYEEIDGIQASVVDPRSVSLINQLLNAGKLRTRGVEADATWVVTPEFRLNTGVAYVKADYAGFAFGCNSEQLATRTCPNSPLPGLADVTGNPAIGSPKWKASLSADYEKEIGGSGLSYYLQASYTYTSHMAFELNDEPLTREPHHGMLNASIGLKGPNDKWDLQLFGKNLTNEFYYSALLSPAAIGRPIAWFARDFERYGGVKLAYRF